MLFCWGGGEVIVIGLVDICVVVLNVIGFNECSVI